MEHLRFFSEAPSTGSAPPSARGMPRAAREDHLLRALRIALDEVDTEGALLFHEMIERIDRADDFFQVFPALALQKPLPLTHAPCVILSMCL